MKDEIPEKIEVQRQWFDFYVDRLENHSVNGKAESDSFLPCPCCGSETLGERGGFEICDVCNWEDDGQDNEDADTIRGGPNGALSLTQARNNYQEIGVSEKRFLNKGRPRLP